MSEELDNELRKRINEVFENYEDTSAADDGWLLLRGKFPQNKKRRVAPVWWSAAATLLLLCLFGLWFTNKLPSHEQAIVKQHKETLSPAKQSTPASPKPALPAHNDTVPLKPAEEYITALKKLKPIILPDEPVSTSKHFSDTNTAPYTSANSVDEQQQIAALKTTSSLSNLSPVNNSQLTVIQDTANGNSWVVPAQQGMLLSQKPVNKARTDSVNDSRMSVFLANENNTNKPSTESKRLTDKKILYSIYAATYFNYAQGSKSQVNTGAGFGTDIRLTKKLKISTGVAIAQNTLAYNGQPTQAGLQNDALAASQSVSQNAALDASAPNTSLGFVSNSITSNAVVSGYNVSLTGLDIPVNIKYEFNPGKNDTYVSAGLSSGTFINEIYNYTYSSGNNTVGSLSPLVTDATTRTSFGRFDFARTLNLSLGMGYQITRHNRLVIEPFFKYPLSGLGTQQIRFGAGGINLRFKFQGKK